MSDKPTVLTGMDAFNWARENDIDVWVDIVELLQKKLGRKLTNEEHEKSVESSIISPDEDELAQRVIDQFGDDALCVHLNDDFSKDVRRLVLRYFIRQIVNNPESEYAGTAFVIDEYTYQDQKRKGIECHWSDIYAACLQLVEEGKLTAVPLSDGSYGQEVFEHSGVYYFYANKPLFETFAEILPEMTEELLPKLLARLERDYME